MASSAPWGSNTPGPKTYGWESIFCLSTCAGGAQRDAGTSKPVGRRGVVASFIGFSLVQGQLLSWSTWQSSRQLHSTTSAVTITLEDRVSLFINPNLSNPLMESHS